MLASELLDQAAEHLDRVGLYQGGVYFDPEVARHISEVPCCAIGALQFLSSREAGLDATYYSAYETLSDWVVENTREVMTVGWSDSAPNKETVVAGLRGAADLARQREAA